MYFYSIKAQFWSRRQSFLLSFPPLRGVTDTTCIYLYLKLFKITIIISSLKLYFLQVINIFKRIWMFIIIIHAQIVHFNYWFKVFNNTMMMMMMNRINITKNTKHLSSSFSLLSSSSSSTLLFYVCFFHACVAYTS